MRQARRKTTPKVKDGKVQRKNRSAETPNYYNTPPEVPAIIRERPGRGCRHLLRKQDIVDFLSILPDWEDLSRGLNAIILGSGGGSSYGWWEPGEIVICAWDRELRQEWTREYVDEHSHYLDRLDVPFSRTDTYGGKPIYTCEFTEESARAFQLMNVLFHELGHHHDCMTTKSQRDAARGESYAEQYANRYAVVLWERYFEVFGY